MFKCLPFWKWNRNIDYMDKRHCILTSVPADVFRYSRTLEELLLDANQISELPPAFFRLIHLKKLSLSDNEISRLPGNIANFTCLVELDISKNDVPEIPETIKFCKNLQIVDFSANPIQRLPDTITQLRSLVHLAVNDISMQRLPADIGSLSNLKSFEVRENLLKVLPQSLSFLINLKVLDLGCNCLDKLPENIGELPALEEFWLDRNELVELPIEIGKLSSLTQIDLSENKLELLPEEIAGLVNLTDLLLSQNSLEYLPDSICTLTKLSILKVDQNRLNCLPEHIGGCVSLQELILTENNIEALPLSIGKLSELSNFNIDRNQLTSLPKELGKCTKLTVLSLRDNRIMYLPIEIGDLHDLHVLDVAGNRLIYLPVTITMCDLKALWLSENQTQPILKFQTDFDENSGQQILTCFLLPQQAYHTESMENLLRGSTDQDSRLSWNQMETARTSCVQFSNDVNALDEDEGETGQFVRHNTPHPKDLKARHPKMFPAETPVIPTPIVQPPPPSPPQTVSNESSIAQRAQAAPVSPPTLPSQNSYASPIYANIKKSEVVRNNVSIKPTALVIEEHEKHVGFNETDSDSEIDVTETESKLRRRDTPHHLKNKRIASSMETSTSGSCDQDKQRVADILAKAARSNFNQQQNQQQDQHDYENTENLYHEYTVLISRSMGQGLGISIAGGKGSPAYIGEDEAIFISRVSADGPAGLAGIKQADKLVKVNEHTLVDADHHLAVNVLKSTGLHITMVVQRSGCKDEQPKTIAIDKLSKNVDIINKFISTTIHRKQGEGLGFNIAGGNDSTINSIFISKITEDGAAHKNNVLEVGDKLISIDNINITKKTHEEVVDLLMKSTNSVKLEIQRDELVDITKNENSATKQSTRPNSVSIGPPPTPPSSQPPVTPTFDLSLQQKTNPPPSTLPKPTPMTTADGVIKPLTNGIKSTFPFETVIIEKNGGSLGLSVVGGIDHTSHPFGINEPGIFISRIITGGPASRTKLKIGDRILKVNNEDITRSKHQEVVSKLVSTNDLIYLQVRHDPPPTGLREITIERLPTDKLGIGGAHSAAGNPLDDTDDGVFVYKIRVGGAIERDGRLKVGDRLLEVDGNGLLGATHQDAVRILKQSQSPIVLMICDGFDKNLLEERIPQITQSHSNTNNPSLWSIDDLDSVSKVKTPTEENIIGNFHNDTSNNIYPHTISKLNNNMHQI